MDTANDDGKPIMVAERNSMHALNGDKVLVHISAAREGMVLLSNSQELLPLDPQAYRKIGLFGQNIMYNVVASCLMYYLQFTVLIPAMTAKALLP